MGMRVELHRNEGVKNQPLNTTRRRIDIIDTRPTSNFLQFFRPTKFFCRKKISTTKVEQFFPPNGLRLIK